MNLAQPPALKPLLLSTYDQFGGGAPRATYRLHQALRQLGVLAHLMVDSKTSDDATIIGPTTELEKGLVRLKPVLNRLPLKRYPQRQPTPFSAQWLPERSPAKIAQLNPNLIHLHWVCDGFIKIENLGRYGKPLIWTLRDMWPFTGGCHYSYTCQKYTQTCGKCPQLNSNHDHDLSRRIWQRKAKAWKALNLTVVALSHWMATCARNSTLFQNKRIEVIPNGIDTNIYRPFDVALARQIFNLPPNKTYILFGAQAALTDERKGFALLSSALQALKSKVDDNDIALLIFGATKPPCPPNLGYKTHYLGTLCDDVTLALLYAAADLFVLPSQADNLPNTVLEAMACGTPCVSFAVGGVPDLIDHQVNGYLAEPFSSQSLATGIAWLLADEARRKQCASQARCKVESTFTREQIARQHLNLYQQVMEAQGTP